MTRCSDQAPRATAAVVCSCVGPSLALVALYDALRTGAAHGIALGWRTGIVPVAVELVGSTVAQMLVSSH